MEKEVIANKICELINITLILLEYCKKFYDLYNHYRSNLLIFEKTNFKKSEFELILRMFNRVFFNKSLMIISSILAKTQNDPNKKELSIFELIELETDHQKKENLIKSVKSFRDKFEEKDLYLFRNKLIAHKDIDIKGSFVITYLSFVKVEYINFLIELLTEINRFLLKNFDVEFSLSYKEILSIDKLIELLKTEIENL